MSVFVQDARPGEHRQGEVVAWATDSAWVVWDGQDPDTTQPERVFLDELRQYRLVK